MPLGELPLEDFEPPAERSTLTLLHARREVGGQVTFVLGGTLPVGGVVQVYQVEVRRVFAAERDRSAPDALQAATGAQPHGRS